MKNYIYSWLSDTSMEFSEQHLTQNLLTQTWYVPVGTSSNMWEA